MGRKRTFGSEVGLIGRNEVRRNDTDDAVPEPVGGSGHADTTGTDGEGEHLADDGVLLDDDRLARQPAAAARARGAPRRHAVARSARAERGRARILSPSWTMKITTIRLIAVRSCAHHTTQSIIIRYIAPYRVTYSGVNPDP